MFHVCATRGVMADERSVDWLGVLGDCLDNYPLEQGDDRHLPMYSILSDTRIDAPFRVYSPHHIGLSLWNLEGLSQYTGLGVERHLLLYLHLAMLQRKALLENPLLKQEDLIHSEADTCLFNRPAVMEDYAHQIEGFSVCDGCQAFYQCLSCERELEELTTFRKRLECCQ